MVRGAVGLEPQIRRSEGGLRARQAQSPETDMVAPALELVVAGGIDAAVLDVNLRGGERSWPVADALAERGVPFLFATGGSEDGIAERYRDRPTLAKPFTMDSVAKALDALG